MLTAAQPDVNRRSAVSYRIHGTPRNYTCVTLYMSKKDDFTCGIKDQKQRTGSMKECVNRNQIRYWGVKKVDSRVLAQGSSKDLPKKRQKMITQMIIQRAIMKKLKEEYIYSKSKGRKEEIKKAMPGHADKLKAINAKLRAIDKEIEKGR